MKKDFEDKALLFPEFDPGILALSLEEDKAMGRVKSDTEGRLDKLYDTLDDCMCEIEDLKDELATIVHTQTGSSMRDRWDTPETKIAGGKKGRLRKDRYSALLMANMVARTLQRTPAPPPHVDYGGFAHGERLREKSQVAWVGPAWFTEAQAADSMGAVVHRR